MKKPTTLDEIFGEYEAQRLAEIARDETPEAIARREAKRRAEVEREKRQGLRDENGDWIEQPETDDEGEGDEGDDE